MEFKFNNGKKGMFYQGCRSLLLCDKVPSGGVFEEQQAYYFKYMAGDVGFYCAELDIYVSPAQAMSNFSLLHPPRLWEEEKIAAIAETPAHYDNEHGSLYKIAQERGWNAYQFDIVKRIDRCLKKGEFKSDMTKTKGVIDLWLKEAGNEK